MKKINEITDEQLDRISFKCWLIALVVFFSALTVSFFHIPKVQWALNIVGWTFLITSILLTHLGKKREERRKEEKEVVL